MTRILVDGNLVCAECKNFNKNGKIVVTGGRTLSPITVEGLLNDGILHGRKTKHMRYTLTVGGEADVATLDFGMGMSAIPPIVLPDGRVTR